LIVGRAGSNPALEDGHLPLGEVRTSGSRHALADNARPAFELLNDVAVVRIAGNNADRAGLAAAGDADERRKRDLVTQVQTAARRPAAGVGVTLGTRCASGGISRFEYLALNARKRRLQIRRRSGEVGELLITRDSERAESDKKNHPERSVNAGFEHGGRQLQVKGWAPTCKAGSDLLGRSFDAQGDRNQWTETIARFFAGKSRRIT